MTQAGIELQNGDKVLDVALRYGYDSPTALNRAVQVFYRIPPSITAQNGVKLNAFSYICFKFILRGTEEMEYQVVSREAFRMVAFRTPLRTDQEERFGACRNSVGKLGPGSETVPLMNGDPVGVLEVSICEKKDNDYYIAVASDARGDRGVDRPRCGLGLFYQKQPAACGCSETPKARCLRVASGLRL